MFRSLKVRLIVSFGLFAVIIVATSIFSRVNNFAMEDTHAEEVRLEAALADALVVQQSLTIQGTLQTRYALTQDPQLLVDFEEASTAGLEAMSSVAAAFPDHAALISTARRLRAYKSAHDWIVLSKMNPAFTAGNTELGLANLAEAEAELGRLQVITDDAVRLVRADFLAVSDELSDRINRAHWTSRIGLGGSIVFALITGFVIRPIIVRLPSITRRAKQIADGDLTARPLAVRSKDELGELASSFNDMAAVLRLVGDQAERIGSGALSDPLLDEELPGQLGTSMSQMTGSLRTMVDKLRVSSRDLAAASRDLAAVSTDLSTSADQTASEASSASAAGEQASANMTMVSGAVDEMHTSISEVATSARDASSIVASAVTTSQESTESIRQLGESSNEIGDVVKVINAIAEQTNLLALNATIEAARAGEAGKGFAVVANEVKELANQTSAATEDIGKKISTIQTHMARAFETNHQIEETISRIDEISTAIEHSVEQQSSAAQTISKNVADASEGTNGIAQGIAGVASRANDTRAATSRAHDSADNLEAMAAELDELVSLYS